MRKPFFPRFFFYLLYGLVLMSVLLYIRFPADSLKTYCEHRLEQFTGVEKCSIGRIIYHFPFAVELKRIRFFAGSGERNRITIDDLQLFPVKKKFFGQWRLEGSCYGGSLSGLLEVKLKRKVYSLQDFRLENIDLSPLSKSIPALGRKLKGRLDFTGDYKARFDKPAWPASMAHLQRANENSTAAGQPSTVRSSDRLLAGTGQGNLVLKQGRIQLSRSVLTLEEIDFNEINIRLQLQDQLLLIREGRMDGKDVDARLAGTIQGPFFPPHGSLQISGLLFPREKFLAGRPAIARFFGRLKQSSRKPALRFRIGGTLTKPTFRLSATATR